MLKNGHISMNWLMTLKWHIRKLYQTVLCGAVCMCVNDNDILRFSLFASLSLFKRRSISRYSRTHKHLCHPLQPHHSYIIVHLASHWHEALNESERKRTRTHIQAQIVRGMRHDSRHLCVSSACVFFPILYKSDVDEEEEGLPLNKNEEEVI